MAARTGPLTETKLDEMRRRIKATLLIKKLEDHVLSGAEMAASQVNAARILLGKVIPDLGAVTLKGDSENPLHMVTQTKAQRDAAVAAAARADA